MTDLSYAIEILESGDSLTARDMKNAISAMMDGSVPDSHIERFLISLSAKGESAEEITGAALALREKASLIKAPDGALDCCGTGGDGMHTYNISTAVAFVSAACGVPMAKHGNRAASSKSGAADVLEALGVNIDLPHAAMETALQELGFCFLMAPKHHKSVRHVAEVRKKIGKRTIFNLIGPLANPAGTSKQLIGVFGKAYVPILAHALKELGTKAAWIVHGADGLDEITLTDKTYVAELHDGTVREFEITPEDFGLPRCEPAVLKGGDAQTNAEALRGILRGEKNAYRDIVILNTAAVLHVAGVAKDYKECAAIAAEALDHGAAQDVLDRYVELSRKYEAAA